jgi:hypothetical protein
LADAFWHAFVQYRGVPGLLFRRADRGLRKISPQPAHKIGTCVGSDETVSGAQVSGGNVAASGGVDAMVGGAADDPAGGGADLNDLSPGDDAGGLDLPPLRAPAAVVPRQDLGELGCLHEVGDPYRPFRGKYIRITGHAVQRTAGEP